MNKRQVVKYESIISSEIDISSGVLQGGIMSPRFFNIYTADMRNCITSNLFCFADDTIIMRPIYKEEDCKVLQNDIDNMINYLNLNHLKVNSSKCKCMRISNKTTTLYKYNVNGISLDYVLEHKRIGINYDTKMSFKSHINYIIEKTYKKFNLIRFLGKDMNGSTMINLYKTYILPILEYSNLCLTFNMSQNKRLENVQRKKTRYLCLKLNIFNFDYEKRRIVKSKEIRNS